ncbi:MAG: NAD(P)/FAD-dependent oxidoreductase [Christensenellales bacterium]
MAKTVVVGGGPAGMLAAATAAQRGHEVTLIEQNEKLGKKLYITGKGRCNLTNIADAEEVFRNIPRNPKFLYSALSRFGSEDVIALVESLGVPVKRERGGRVFPVSDKSSDVIFALGRHLKACGVQTVFNTAVRSIDVSEGRIAGVRTDQGPIKCEALVIATGGVSYPSTGSTGDGYEFAKALGHTVIPPKPALIPMLTKEAWPKTLSGLTLKNVRLTAFSGRKIVFDELGEMLFTHFGVSGPLVLSASSMVNQDEPVTLVIDLKPGLTPSQLDARILRDFAAYANKSARNGMVDLLPNRMIPVVLSVAGVDEEKIVHQITREERIAIGNALKALKLHVSGYRPLKEAIVTRGGVSVKEINPSTMESKLVGGLFFAGEVMDVDALTGGFNLQIAFSTGHLAGLSICDE